jgi:hypothetical protein
MVKEFEKTQPGNPHQLTKNQHIFPTKSIERFLSPQGMVKVHRKKDNKVFDAAPKNPCFCTQRAWSERAEKGFGKSIEDGFQSFVEKSILGPEEYLITQQDTNCINRLLLLWQLRYQYKKQRSDIQMQGIIDSMLKLSWDEAEQLEKCHAGYVQANGTIPAREMNSLDMEVKILENLERYNTITQWSIIQAQAGEFIVPDTFGDRHIVPLSPTICLISPVDVPNGMIAESKVAEINRIAIEKSEDYYFARDFSHCPL